MKLALWCEAHGLSAERTKHLMLAVLLDPANTAARGLMGLVSYQGKWQAPADVAREVQEDPARKALLKEYLQRRARTSDRPDDQWKLALWCDEHGMKEQAKAHLYQVLKRDPRREAAWQRLGFKKIGGRWVKPEWLAIEKAELEAQSRASSSGNPASSTGGSNWALATRPGEPKRTRRWARSPIPARSHDLEHLRPGR